MRLIHSWIGNEGKPIMTASGPRYQARWRVIGDGARREIERKRTDFLTKGKAKLFMEELDKAHHGATDQNGRQWRFDADGHPTNLRDADTTVIGAIELYVRNRWFTEWQAAQRTKVRGRMLLVAIELTSLTKEKKKGLVAALETQRSDRGPRPTPTTKDEWAARWLRDHAFFPNQDVELGDEMTQAKSWLEQVSAPLCTLGVTEVTDLRLFLVGESGKKGLKHNTRRAYWNGVVVPFFTWLYESGMVEKSLTRGQPKIKRDMEGEQPDPTKILEPAHVALLGGWFRRHYGEVWELFPLIATFCALRIGEALYIRLSDFVCRSGRWYLCLGPQIHATTKAYSDHGTGKEVRNPKSLRNTTPKKREIPLPPKIAQRLVDLFGVRLGTDDAHLFRGPRGAVGNTTCVRQWWEKALAEVVVPIVPRFAGLTPHAMRHAGMTYWFDQKFDEKLIQRWGGWKSVVVMQDTYRGVLESSEERDLAGLDEFDGTWRFDGDITRDNDPERSTHPQITNIDDGRRYRQSVF